VNAKICFVEIGAQGTTIDQATKDRLAALVEQATTQTAATVQSTTAKRQYVYGTYVDELLSYTNNGTRYFTHSNHLYSPSAVTNTAGQVQERYRYDAYGKRTVTNAAGTVTLSQSAVGQTRGFTGYILDEATGLYHARARQYDSRLGRFVGRDKHRLFTNGFITDELSYVPSPGDGYIDGMNLFSAYFIPNYLDPLGLYCKEVETSCGKLIIRARRTNVGHGVIVGPTTGIFSLKFIPNESCSCTCESISYDVKIDRDSTSTEVITKKGTGCFGSEVNGTWVPDNCQTSFAPLTRAVANISGDVEVKCGDELLTKVPFEARWKNQIMALGASGRASSIMEDNALWVGVKFVESGTDGTGSGGGCQ